MSGKWVDSDRAQWVERNYQWIPLDVSVAAGAAALVLDHPVGAISAGSRISPGADSLLQASPQGFVSASTGIMAGAGALLSALPGAALSVSSSVLSMQHSLAIGRHGVGVSAGIRIAADVGRPALDHVAWIVSSGTVLRVNPGALQIGSSRATFSAGVSMPGSTQAAALGRHGCSVSVESLVWAAVQALAFGLYPARVREAVIRELLALTSTIRKDIVLPSTVAELLLLSSTVAAAEGLRLESGPCFGITPQSGILYQIDLQSGIAGALALTSRVRPIEDSHGQ